MKTIGQIAAAIVAVPAVLGMVLIGALISALPIALGIWLFFVIFS